jgi:hypothetical protein
MRFGHAYNHGNVFGKTVLCLCVEQSLHCLELPQLLVS